MRLGVTQAHTEALACRLWREQADAGSLFRRALIVLQLQQGVPAVMGVSWALYVAVTRWIVQDKRECILAIHARLQLHCRQIASAREDETYAVSIHAPPTISHRWSGLGSQKELTVLRRTTAPHAVLAAAGDWAMSNGLTKELGYDCCGFWVLLSALRLQDAQCFAGLPQHALHCRDGALLSAHGDLKFQLWHCHGCAVRLHYLRGSVHL